MIAYFDCFSGIAGDMVLGALVDCGLPWNHLTRELKKLKLTGYKINKEVALRKGIRGVSITVDGGKSNEEFSYKEIIQLIESSKLKSDTKDIASDIFTALGMAESKVHGCNLADVHFHEVGAIDSIVDIVGAAIGFEYFNFDKVYSSPLPVTRGFVKCRHGKFPVPPPAVLELIKGVPLQKSSVKAEIVTPTGAAIITTLADGFGENPIYSLKSVGYGQGDRNFKEIPNSLRLMIGEGYPVWIVETNIDDMNPQIYDYVSDKLFRAGAVDV
ncbi:nickel pincer cofactor biosynthesis protein LarC, partial [bacterium]|nr:nickel pincer cofactor biosynthesis protein LarC [bacterium]